MAVLTSTFAQTFPELSVPWQAESTDQPQLMVLNRPLAEQLGLDPDWLETDDGVRFLTGERPTEGSQPVAQGYAGHQFGMYSPRLGDGRALLLGELTDAHGRNHEIHLKGSGRTPYARGGADGQAVLAPMLREYLVSEAMHVLGVPSTRALAVLTTGREVYRDSGGPGAMLVRTADSHLRVGTFQYAQALDASDQTNTDDLVERLVDESLRQHYPALVSSDDEPAALRLFRAVAQRQADLVAQWMLLGFIHGVMNTDNVTISGQSIDYGPCAFMDAFDPQTVFSSIDAQGRYAYGNQPPIAEWNIARFGETLLPLIDDDPNQAIEAAQQVLDTFSRTHHDVWTRGLRAKLGISEDRDDVDEESFKALTDRLFSLMNQHRTDFTSFFRALATAVQTEGDIPAGLAEVITDDDEFRAWVADWRALEPDAELMDRVNPIYIPRNHLVDEALEAAAGGDLSPFEQLLSVLQNPYEEQPDAERYARPAPGSFGSFVTYCGT